MAQHGNDAPGKQRPGSAEMSSGLPNTGGYMDARGRSVSSSSDPGADAVSSLTNDAVQQLRRQRRQRSALLAGRTLCCRCSGGSGRLAAARLECRLARGRRGRLLRRLQARALCARHPHAVAAAAGSSGRSRGRCRGGAPSMVEEQQVLHGGAEARRPLPVPLRRPGLVPRSQPGVPVGGRAGEAGEQDARLRSLPRAGGADEGQAGAPPQPSNTT